MKTQVIIVGGGEVGGHVAALLSRGGRQVVLVERDPARAPALRDLTVVLGDGTDPEVLEAAGIVETEILAAVTGSDEVNLAVASLARLHFGVGRTVARVNVARHAWLFTPDLGVDVALNQAEVLGRVIEAEAASRA